MTKMQVQTWMLILSLSELFNIVLSEELALEDRVERDCDRRCHCHVESREVFVDCTRLHLDYAPRHHPEETTHLYFRFNQFKRVTKELFQKINTPNLFILDISHCEIATIDGDAFENASFKDSLSMLYLSNNNLSDTQELISLITKFRNLKYIDLRHNTRLMCSEVAEQVGDVLVMCDKTGAMETTTSAESLATTQNEHSATDSKTEHSTDPATRPTNSEEISTSFESPYTARPSSRNSTVIPYSNNQCPNQDDQIIALLVMGTILAIIQFAMICLFFVKLFNNSSIDCRHLLPSLCRKSDKKDFSGVQSMEESQPLHESV